MPRAPARSRNAPSAAAAAAAVTTKPKPHVEAGGKQRAALTGAQAVLEEKHQRLKVYEGAVEETKRLMYAAGDVPAAAQLPETVSAVMAATEQYMRELTARLVRRHRTHAQGSSGARAGITRDLDSVLFLLHRDRRAHERALYLLDAKERADKASKQQGIYDLAHYGDDSPSDDA